jgi:hypothetical protein
VPIAVDRWLSKPEVEDFLKINGHNISIRELESLSKALTTFRGLHSLNLAKLHELDKEITHQKDKVEESQTLDASIRRHEEEMLKKLETDRVNILVATANSRDALRSQIDRIRATIDKILLVDTTLGERIKTLFREQGITIVSIITALGMTISTILLAIIKGRRAAVSPSPPPPGADKGSVKEWMKARLQDLGRLLTKLADKAAAALPGIIGSIVSWLLTTAQKAVGWLAENLWALIVGVVGLAYLTAKDYMSLPTAKYHGS